MRRMIPVRKDLIQSMICLYFAISRQDGSYDLGFWRLEPTSISLDGMMGLINMGTGCAVKGLQDLLGSDRGASQDTAIEVAGVPVPGMSQSAMHDRVDRPAPCY